MDQISRICRWGIFILVMVARNLKWLIILLLSGNERPWPVLNFKMMLCARKAGFDLKGKSIHKQLILNRVRERKSTEIMNTFLRPDDVILELGANIGYYVLIEAKRLSDRGFIYAVEPDPENFELLKRNVTLNHLTNIELNALAMSSHKGTAKLYQGTACNLHSLINYDDSAAATYIEVQTDTVDDFLANRRPITFIRMDIEGYETEIIKTMATTLRSPSLERLFIEIHPHLVDPKEMKSFLVVLQNHHFGITHAVSRDTHERFVLGQSKVERLSLQELISDPRIVEEPIGFQLFLQRA